MLADDTEDGYWGTSAQRAGASRDDFRRNKYKWPVTQKEYKALACMHYGGCKALIASEHPDAVSSPEDVPKSVACKSVGLSTDRTQREKTIKKLCADRYKHSRTLKCVKWDGKEERIVGFVFVKAVLPKESGKEPHSPRNSYPGSGVAFRQDQKKDLADQMSPVDSDVNQPRLRHSSHEAEPERPQPRQHRNAVLQKVFENWSNRTAIFELDKDDTDRFLEENSDGDEHSDDGSHSPGGSRKRKRLNTLLDHKDCPRMEISHLKVENKEGKRGLGKLLFVAALEHINRQYDSQPWLRRALMCNWSLSVYGSNERAKNFYRKIGMKELEAERHTSVLKEQVPRSTKAPHGGKKTAKKDSEENGLKIAWTKFVRQVKAPESDDVLHHYISNEIIVQKALQAAAASGASTTAASSSSNSAKTSKNNSNNSASGSSKSFIGQRADFNEIVQYVRDTYYSASNNYHARLPLSSSSKRNNTRRGNASDLFPIDEEDQMDDASAAYANGAAANAKTHYAVGNGHHGAAEGDNAAALLSRLTGNTSKSSGSRDGPFSDSKQAGSRTPSRTDCNAFLKNPDRLTNDIVNAMKSTLPRETGQLNSNLAPMPISDGASSVAGSTISRASRNEKRDRDRAGDRVERSCLHASFSTSQLLAGLENKAGGGVSNGALSSGDMSNGSFYGGGGSGAVLPPISQPLHRELGRLFATEACYDLEDSGSEGESEVIPENVLKQYEWRQKQLALQAQQFSGAGEPGTANKRTRETAEGGPMAATARSGVGTSSGLAKASKRLKTD
eukprot:g720.t1